MSRPNVVTESAVPRLPADPQRIQNAVHDLRRASVNVDDNVDAVSSRWHRLSDAYETGHTDQVLAQVKPLHIYAQDLAAAFRSAADALAEYAEALAEADSRRVALLERIANLYRQINTVPVPFEERPDLRDRNSPLWQEIYSLERILNDATESARRRLARIPDPPELPLESSSAGATPGASRLEGMHQLLLNHLSAPVFAMLQGFMDMPLPLELVAALARVSETSGPVDEDTSALEEAWLLWGIANGGELHQDEDGLCGTRMVCVVGDLPTGPPGNAMVLGRVAVFDDHEPSAWWRFHEYAHVVDQVEVGSRHFLSDYAKESAFTTTIGEDPHDGNIFEQSADLRADTAESLSSAGHDPYEAFKLSHYDSGYQPVTGTVDQWLTWDAVAKGNLTNEWRLWPMRRNMGIDEVGE